MKQCLANPACVFIGVIGVSALALAAAFTAQFVYGLAPCQLCLYQRVPFAAAILIAAIGLWALKKPDTVRALLALDALVFAANAIIAAYHSGVERKLWRSMFEGCAVSFEARDKDLLQSIMAGKAARCDEIPWADPLLGLSMANYNALMCASIAGLLVYALIKQFQKR
ncbi:MAG: disulfide bond formation protein B [Alphaproteobacteria bacterium]